jgi:hypothetical protein
MVVKKYLTVLSGKYPANLYRIPDSAGCLNFTGYRYPDPAHRSLLNKKFSDDYKHFQDLGVNKTDRTGGGQFDLTSSPT